MVYDKLTCWCWSRVVKKSRMAQVSEAEACSLVAGFWDEIKDLPGVQNIPSAMFLQAAERLSSTNHESRLGQTMSEFGLSANIRISYVNVNMNLPHPVLSARDFVQGLSHEGRLDVLFCGHDETDYALFWKKFEKNQPKHPVFTKHAKHLGMVIPVWLHADEGTSIKKRALMIIQWQPVLGYGTSRGGSGLNFVGVSVTTRFLYGVMTGRVYMGSVAKGKRLQALTTAFATDLADCFETPLRVVHDGEARDVYLCPIGFKGDWPALVKMGELRRHHLRDTFTSEDGAGICHLCMGGCSGHQWFDISYNNMVKMKSSAVAPWNRPPSLISCLPHSPDHEAQFFRIDVFHNLHKGVLADSAANAIVARSVFVVRIRVVSFRI